MSVGRTAVGALDIEVEVVGEEEVDLLLHHIDILDLDQYGVAEFVGLAVAAADNLVVVFVEHIVVVGEASDGDHAFALVALNLGIDAPFAYA